MISQTMDERIVEASGGASSGVSWGAILAGAAAAAALSFILVILGFGLGFSTVSPWSGEGLSAETIGYSTVAWVAFTQIAASAIGGYIAGRLRVKWSDVHTDEVYFRDTAHGFLAWSVASLATAALLSSAVGAVLSGGAKVVGAAGTAAVAASGAAITSGTTGNDRGSENLSGYFIDSLFRPGANSAQGAVPATNPPPINRDNTVMPAQRLEVSRIFANGLRTGHLPNADISYIAQLLSQRSGISKAEAEKRVIDTYTQYKQNVEDMAHQAKEAADAARKAAAYGSLWMFVTLLCGAFVASFMATYGGRRRDRIDMHVSDRPAGLHDQAQTTIP